MNKIFIQPQEELEKESWRLMLGQPSEEEIRKEKQNKILERIFG